MPAARGQSFVLTGADQAIGRCSLPPALFSLVIGDYIDQSKLF
jgi:hypothetical protein